MVNEILDLENSLKVVKGLDLADYIVLPIKSNINNFKKKINKIGFPCWIKVNIPEHKLEKKGVEKCENLDELKKTHDKLKKNFPGKKFIVQKDIEGIEVLAGIKKDKTFNKTLLIAAGGNLTELLQDKSFRIIPLNKKDIHEALKELKIYPILKEKGNIKNLVKQIHKLTKIEKIEEADFNPIIVNKKQVKIVDARVSV